jgi:hypothetical protein
MMPTSGTIETRVCAVPIDLDTKKASLKVLRARFKSEF